jgi:hypothetical protein
MRCSIYTREEKCSVLLGNPEGEGLLGRPRCRWVCNVKVDIQDMGGEGMDWIHWNHCGYKQWAVENIVTDLCVP